jgi:hypothetical protein
MPQFRLARRLRQLATSEENVNREGSSADMNTLENASVTLVAVA